MTAARSSGSAIVDAARGGARRHFSLGDEGGCEGEGRSADARTNAWRGKARACGSRPRKGRCSPIGGGQAAADRLKHSAEQRNAVELMRRVVVKPRIVRLKRGTREPPAICAVCNVMERPGKESAGGCMGRRPTRRIGENL
jgi:hypothetical protein